MSPRGSLPTRVSTAAGPTTDRSALFLDLARRMTAAHPRWLLFKDPYSAMHGTGDLDSAAPDEDFDGITGTFREWAAAHGLSPVIACRHGSLGLVLATFQPVSRAMLELDVLRARGLRGGRLFGWEDLTPFAVDHPDGFRTVKRGTQGVLKLLWNGIGYGGRRRERLLAVKHVRELLVEDPVGARATLALLGDSARDAARLVDAVAGGRWDRRAALKIELRYLARAAAHPLTSIRALHFRFVTLRRCPVFAVMTTPGRQAPADLDGWLSVVERTHEVTRATA